MEPGYLIDTNVIIDNFGNRLPKKSKGISEFIWARNNCGNKGWSAGLAECHGRATNTLICIYGYCFILPINESVIEKTILIGQAKKIGLGDAIIAATALVHSLVLISRNISDFKNIPGLKTIDPYTL